GRSGGRRSSTPQPSSSDTTTRGQSTPGSATSSIRAGSRPVSAAAATPACGTPAMAHQAPAADAPAASARQSSPQPRTATTVPRGRPRGSSSARAGSTGSAPTSGRAAASPASADSRMGRAVPAPIVKLSNTNSTYVNFQSQPARNASAGINRVPAGLVAPGVGEEG